MEDLRDEVMHENHPVYQALLARLSHFTDQYRRHPSEHTRYCLVRQEQLIAQWAPGTTAFP
ncbi:hypothetical protein [Synechococcus sp. CCY 9618]|uniref:hypothetical protein n=1 Tax=Synechococcus sp. CCY 9618 TaxID=2815602 RepID=UPI001C22F597|nr:hypothetical protein [Synechococcus sp. CCY 9618]